MFIGEYQHNLDAKNRIIIPSKFRDELEESFILTRGIDTCITIYTKKHFDTIVEKLRTLPDYSKATRAYKKLILSSACEVSLDNMGRIQIPNFLKAILGDEKECKIVGIDDHIEIWNSSKWEEFYSDTSLNIEEISEEIGMRLI